MTSCCPSIVPTIPMTDPKPPKRQYRARFCPEGYVTLSGLCFLLNIDKVQARKLLSQKRLPEPVRVQRGTQVHLFFNLDLIKGKGAIKGQATPIMKRLPKAFS